MCGLGGLGGKFRVRETTVAKAVSGHLGMLEEGITYNFDSAVPGTGTECVLRYQIPMYGKDFSIMLFPASNRKLI